MLVSQGTLLPSLLSFVPSLPAYALTPLPSIVFSLTSLASVAPFLQFSHSLSLVKLLDSLHWLRLVFLVLGQVQVL